MAGAKAMNNPENQIVSRPAGGIWAGIGMMLFFFFGLIIAAVDSPPKPHEIWIAALFIVASGLAAFSLLLTMARHRVIADQRGLRWRGAFGRWKSARWDEVRDFSLSGSGKNSSHVVETSQGQLRFDGSDTRVEELAQFIAARATEAPVKTWLLSHERKDARFELVFPTPLVSARAILLAAVPIVLIILALLMALTPRDLALWQNTRETAGWTQATGIYLGPLALAAAFLSLFPTAIVAQIISARWFGQIERIVATERGLRLETPGETLQIAWSELRAVHLFEQRTFNTRARFETARGHCEVGWKIGLQPLIERFAPDVPIFEESDLAPPVRLENGALFYSFRTTGLRLMLRVFTTMAIFVALLPLLMWFAVAFGDTPRDNPRGMWLMLVPLGAFCLWQWRLYRRGGVALGESGLEVRGAWRDRFYRWDEIETRDGEFMARRGEKLVKLWSLGGPVRRDEVRAEIERRVGQEQPRRPS